LFGTFEFEAFGLVSDFGFRYSDFCSNLSQNLARYLFALFICGEETMPLSRACAGMPLAILLTLCVPALAQRGRVPDIGYVYPAGGQAGTQVEIVIGGMSLDGASDIYVSGAGVSVSGLDFDRPLTNREVNIIQDKAQKAREQLEEEGKSVDYRRKTGAVEEFLALLQEQGVTAEDLAKVDEYRQRRNDPKRQLNPQIEQTVTATLSVDQDVAPGRYEVRVQTPAGLSNPLAFHISPFPEFLEVEPNDAAAGEPIEGTLPVVLNGQIMPGDVDRFRFAANKGDKLVLQASARELMPYLADAVPGWFQATMALYDAAGREVAYADDYQFHPDPVLFYRIPEDGFYDVEIKDSIFRGREDFVYRIEVGELPFLTTVFPMGARVGSNLSVEVDGWNLPVETMDVGYYTSEVGQFAVSVASRRRDSNALPFDVDDLPESLDQEPNNDMATAQVLDKPPFIVNGRIDQPGDWDVFRFDARRGGRVMLEVLARRLDSPLDSLLKLTDANGKEIMVNDDTEDKGTGLVTHHADSRLLVTLPETGTYYLHLGDAQKKGGKQYVYRLRISARRPDFDLRLVPSAINARPGSTVPLTIYALRRDGFQDDIEIRLSGAPEGFELSRGIIPAEKESEELTLSVPRKLAEGIYPLTLIGAAEVKGREIQRPVVPADDMMQAFIYHHLVPADELVVAVSGKAVVQRSAGGSATAEATLKIPSGGTQRYQLPIPGRRNLDDVKVELTNPPDGITILRMIRGLGGLVILFSADAEMAKPGLRGDLTLNVYVERTVPGKSGRPGSTSKVPIGAFPPIPFEVTPR
jgi:hypothetical protein